MKAVSAKKNKHVSGYVSTRRALWAPIFFACPIGRTLKIGSLERNFFRPCFLYFGHGSSISLMEIRNLHLCNLICVFLQLSLEKRVGYEWEGCSNFSRNDDGKIFIVCMKTGVLIKFSLYKFSISQDSKSFLEWWNLFLLRLILKYVFVDCFSFVSKLCVHYSILN